MKTITKVLIGDDSVNFGVICKDLLQKQQLEVLLVKKDGILVYDQIMQENRKLLYWTAACLTLMLTGF